VTAQGSQPHSPRGKPHVNRPLLKSEFQNVFPFPETLGGRCVTSGSIVEAGMTVSNSPFHWHSLTQRSES
jgi:hypothetical protein